MPAPSRRLCWRTVAVENCWRRRKTNSDAVSSNNCVFAQTYFADCAFPRARLTTGAVQPARRLTCQNYRKVLNASPMARSGRSPVNSAQRSSQCRGGIPRSMISERGPCKQGASHHALANSIKLSAACQRCGICTNLASPHR